MRAVEVTAVLLWIFPISRQKSPPALGIRSFTPFLFFANAPLLPSTQFSLS